MTVYFLLISLILNNRFKASIGVVFNTSILSINSFNSLLIGVVSKSKLNCLFKSTCFLSSFSYNANISFARFKSSNGNPAKDATWIPYDLSIAPSLTLCKKTTLPFSSLASTCFIFIF